LAVGLRLSGVFLRIFGIGSGCWRFGQPVGPLLRRRPLPRAPGCFPPPWRRRRLAVSGGPSGGIGLGTGCELPAPGGGRRLRLELWIGRRPRVRWPRLQSQLQRSLPSRPPRRGFFSVASFLRLRTSFRCRLTAAMPSPATASAITPLIQLGGDQGEEGLPSLAVGRAGVELESGGKQS
jgi:hypothetical protein